MGVTEKYDEMIRPEIEALISEVEAGIVSNTEIERMYKGWRVFYSPLIENPEVLFIGINPGNGQAGVTDLEYEGKEKLEYLEYWDDEKDAYAESTYALARETKELFRLADMSEVLNTSAVKTNFFFLSTTAEKDLYSITTFLGRGKQNELLGDKIFLKSAEWTKKLIDSIAPRIVICEGKISYTNVTDLFPEYGEFQDWKDDCAYTCIPEKNMVIIGYSRTFSRINNKEAVAQLLKKFSSRQ